VEEADLKGVSFSAILLFEFDVLFHFGSGGRDFGPLGLLACLGAGGGLSAP
jgi:hypothetical protein